MKRNPLLQYLYLCLVLLFTLNNSGCGCGNKALDEETDPNLTGIELNKSQTKPLGTINGRPVIEVEGKITKNEVGETAEAFLLVIPKGLQPHEVKNILAGFRNKKKNTTFEKKPGASFPISTGSNKMIAYYLRDVGSKEEASIKEKIALTDLEPGDYDLCLLLDYANYGTAFSNIESLKELSIKAPGGTQPSITMKSVENKRRYVGKAKAVKNNLKCKAKITQKPNNVSDAWFLFIKKNQTLPITPKEILSTYIQEANDLPSIDSATSIVDNKAIIAHKKVKLKSPNFVYDNLYYQENNTQPFERGATYAVYGLMMYEEDGKKNYVVSEPMDMRTPSAAVELTLDDLRCTLIYEGGNPNPVKQSLTYEITCAQNTGTHNSQMGLLFVENNLGLTYPEVLARIDALRTVAKTDNYHKDADHILIISDTYSDGSTSINETFTANTPLPLEIGKPYRVYPFVQDHEDKGEVFLDSSGKTYTLTVQLAEVELEMKEIKLNEIFTANSTAANLSITYNSKITKNKGTQNSKMGVLFVKNPITQPEVYGIVSSLRSVTPTEGYHHNHDGILRLNPGNSNGVEDWFPDTVNTTYMPFELGTKYYVYAFVQDRGNTGRVFLSNNNLELAIPSVAVELTLDSIKLDKLFKCLDDPDPAAGAGGGLAPDEKPNQLTITCNTNIKKNAGPTNSKLGILFVENDTLTATTAKDVVSELLSLTPKEGYYANEKDILCIIKDDNDGEIGSFTHQVDTIHIPFELGKTYHAYAFIQNTGDNGEVFLSDTHELKLPKIEFGAPTFKSWKREGIFDIDHTFNPLPTSWPACTQAGFIISRNEIIDPDTELTILNAIKKGPQYTTSDGRTKYHPFNYGDNQAAFFEYHPVLTHPIDFSNIYGVGDVYNPTPGTPKFFVKQVFVGDNLRFWKTNQVFRFYKSEKPFPALEKMSIKDATDPTYKYAFAEYGDKKGFYKCLVADTVPNWQFITKTEAEQTPSSGFTGGKSLSDYLLELLNQGLEPNELANSKQNFMDNYADEDLHIKLHQAHAAGA